MIIIIPLIIMIITSTIRIKILENNQKSKTNLEAAGNTLISCSNGLNGFVFSSKSGTNSEAEMKSEANGA